MLDVRRLEASAESPHVRVALVVPKYGHTAVQRNQLKRRLRELARLHLLPAHCACDVLLRAKKESYTAPFDQLRAEVERVAQAIATSAASAAPTPANEPES